MNNNEEQAVQPYFLGDDLEEEYIAPTAAHQVFESNKSEEETPAGTSQQPPPIIPEDGSSAKLPPPSPAHQDDESIESVVVIEEQSQAPIQYNTNDLIKLPPPEAHQNPESLEEEQAAPSLPPLPPTIQYNADGSIKLPQRFGPYTVLDFGQITTKPAFHNPPFIYPVNYKVQTNYLSMSDPPPLRNKLYTTTILQLPMSPKKLCFMVIQDPTHYVLSDSVQEAWMKVVNDAHAIRGLERRGVIGEVVAHELIGLKHPIIDQVIRKMAAEASVEDGEDEAGKNKGKWWYGIAAKAVKLTVKCVSFFNEKSS